MYNDSNHNTITPNNQRNFRIYTVKNLKNRPTPLEVSFKIDSGRCRSLSHGIRSAKFSDGPPLAPHLRRPVRGPVRLVIVGCCHL